MPFRFSKAVTKKEDFSFRNHVVEEKGIEVNLKVEFVLWNTGEHGKIFDVFAITFMNRALTMEITKDGKFAATREFQIHI